MSGKAWLTMYIQDEEAEEELREEQEGEHEIKRLFS